MCKLTLFFIGNKQICKFTQLYMDWCGLFVGKLCKFYTFFFLNYTQTGWILLFWSICAQKKKIKHKKKKPS